MRLVDFNSDAHLGHVDNDSLGSDWKGVAAVRRTSHFLAGDASHAEVRFSQVRLSLRRQPPGPKFLMYGSVPFRGVCPTDLSRESS